MFIKVTTSLQGRMLMNLNAISEIIDDNGLTKIYMIGDDDGSYYTVQESFDQIENMIMEMQKK